MIVASSIVYCCHRKCPADQPGGAININAESRVTYSGNVAGTPERRAVTYSPFQCISVAARMRPRPILRLTMY